MNKRFKYEEGKSERELNDMSAEEYFHTEHKNLQNPLFEQTRIMSNRYLQYKPPVDNFYTRSIQDNRFKRDRDRDYGLQEEFPRKRPRWFVWHTNTRTQTSVKPENKLEAKLWNFYNKGTFFYPIRWWPNNIAKLALLKPDGQQKGKKLNAKQRFLFWIFLTHNGLDVVKAAEFLTNATPEQHHLYTQEDLARIQKLINQKLRRYAYWNIKQNKMEQLPEHVF